MGFWKFPEMAYTGQTHPKSVYLNVVEPSRLLAFCLSFFVIALSPGLCMTLALSLGIRIGVRRTLWMMLGELTGIALVGFAAIAGIATLILNVPDVFNVLKFGGAAYLLWSAFRAWRSQADLSIDNLSADTSRVHLVTQGFVTAASNPKAWIFLAALIPPFINPDNSLWPQAGILLCAMMIIEFISLLIYATGGRMFRYLLENKGLGKWLNRVSACLMVGVAIWLVMV